MRTISLLIYKGKCEDLYYDISTPSKRDAAYLQLFTMLNEDYHCYDLDEMDQTEGALYLAASKGDAQSAIRLLKMRTDYEYENVFEEELIDATQDI